jgi:small conductance mechanosensitive channel
MTIPDIQLHPWIGQALQLVAIVVLALILFVAIRATIRLAVAHVLERRTADDEREDTLSVMEVQRRMRTLEQLAVRVTAIVIVAIAALTALDTVDISIGPAIAGLGVVGIAVGLGAQTLIKDWLAGIFVVLENQYSQGDVVRIAGVDGVVEDFSLRRTVLRDLDGTVHSVPNGQITVASNLTRVWARVNLDVNVAYGTDIETATQLINQIGERLHADPEWGARMLEAPSVSRVTALGENGVTLKVLGQVRAAEQWAVTGELRKRILAAFAEHGIEIPFPHRVMISRPAEGEPGSD